MRIIRTAIVLCMLAIAGAVPVRADSGSAKPLDLYIRGDYAAAAIAGEKEGTGDSLAVAARAVLADDNLRDTPCLECIRRAETLTQRAIAADPKRTEAYEYYAVALGYDARVVGMLRARLAHYPEKAKQALDTALALSPNDAWTLAALGGWNVEVVRGGGSLLARVLYGASVMAGLDFFHRGIAADPENLVLHFQFALSLSGYDLGGNLEEIEKELKAAAEEAPRTAYEAEIKMRSATMLDLLRQNRRRDYMRLVSRYQGYP